MKEAKVKKFSISETVFQKQTASDFKGCHFIKLQIYHYLSRMKHIHLIGKCTTLDLSLGITIFFTVIFNFNAAGQNEPLLKKVNKEQLDSLDNLALIKKGIAQSDFDSAVFYLNTAKEISIKSGSKYLEGFSVNELALKYFKISQHDSAIYYWEKANVTLMGDVNESSEKAYQILIGEIQYRMAVPYYYKGAYAKALEHLRIALDLYKKNGIKKGIINCYSMLGNIHFAQNEMQLAEKQFSFGIEFAIENKLIASLATLYNNLASTYLAQEKYEEAQNQYLSSIDYIDPQNELSFAQTHMNIGLTYMRLDQLEKAEEYLLQNKAFYKKTTHPRTKITWMNILGELYMRKEQWAKLVSNGQDVLKELENVPLVLIKKSVLEQLSQGYEALGNHKLALIYFKELKNLQDSLLNEDKVKEIKRLEAQLELDKKERDINELERKNLASALILEETENARNLILFISTGLLLMMSVAWIYYRKKEEKQRHLIELKRVELEQRMLRSQMNPHFIFNALNSIQSYVTRNKTYEAEVFLSKFSLLIRKILENSTHQLIDIEEEIETLKLYLELEKLRFQNKFDFIISEDFSDSTIPVPPMLLQPFVENAIVHGMKGKIEQGKIEVRFIEKEQVLICEVEDNGVGRRLEKKDPQKHKSLATELINDRINYFNQMLDRGSYQLEITDLENQEGKPSGTKVNLTIPILV